jgi:DNA-binding transcriptional ArsR family regulator
MKRDAVDHQCGVRTVDPGRVDHVRAQTPDRQTLESSAEIFALLGDPNRLLLLTCLLEAGELCVCDLAAAADMSESSVSHALRLMRARRVVKARRDGRVAYYSLLDSHVRVLLDIALEHVKHAEPLKEV